MRIVGLFALAILFPVFAHADSPPTLTTYTVSYGTIYPSATAGSGLATTTSIDTAFSEQVKASIKIISSSDTLIKSLYTSSSVTNPTPKIWNGTNDSGALVSNGTYTILVSATSTATSLTMTDLSKTVVVASSDTTPPADSSDTTEEVATTETVAAQSAGGGPPEYVPIPTLHIVTGGDRTISSGADTAFTAVVYDGKGNKRDNAMVTWSFGDGMKRVGANVYHQYYEQGEYLAIIRATTSDGGDAFKEITITVKNASIKIASVSARGISLVNDSSRTLDLSLWRLSMGGKEFKIPEDTQILSGRTTLFPSQIIQLPLSDTASLLYPSGEAAATYTSVQAMQPSAPIVSYEKVQTVEPIISKATNIQVYDEAVVAPAAATELAAAGAALPAVASVEQQKSGGLFKSPWFYSLLGVITLAGVAFIFL